MSAVRLAVVCVVLSLVAASGCTQTVNVKTDPPLATLRLNDTDVGEIPAEGREVSVRPSLEPLRYVVEKDGKQRAGTVERSEIDWLWVGLGIGGALVCAPTLAVAGACLANPALATAAIGCLLGANIGACATVLATPGWLTVPATALGFALGMTPFLPVLFAERVPKQLTLAVREDPPAAPAAAALAVQAW